jgi:hypothetical protein
MTFDFTLHVGDLINLVVGAILTGIVWSVRKTYYGIRHFVTNVEIMERRLEAGLEVIDDHSEIIIRAQLTPGPLARVSKRRRLTDYVRPTRPT